MTKYVPGDECKCFVRMVSEKRLCTAGGNLWKYWYRFCPKCGAKAKIMEE